MGYSQPVSMQALLDRLAAGPGRILAGGTDVYPSSGEGLARDSLIDITRVRDLRGIVRTPSGWRIGATTTWTEIAEAMMPPAFDGLRAAAREVGSIQIQNSGTIAGNICNASPAADGMPPLVALGATVRIAGPRGERVVPVAQFVTGVRARDLHPDEVVTAIDVNDPPAGSVGGFAKLGTRRYLVISIAMVSVLLWPGREGRIGGARIAVGACSPVARRLERLETDVTGMTPAELAGFRIAPAHLSPLSPIADVRGSAEYRLDAVAEITGRLLRQTASRLDHAHG